MDTDIRALATIAQTYCDAAYEMDADKFGSIFHPSCSVTRASEDGKVTVTPIETWLSGVRGMKSPKRRGLERHDEILSIDIVGELAVLKLKLQIPPLHFTDVLACLKGDGAWKIVQKVTSLRQTAPE